MTHDATSLCPDKVYQKRFAGEAEYRRQLWQVLCESFFQQFIPVDCTLLEIGAGQCEFINNIKAGQRIAVDINPDTVRYANKNVSVVVALSREILAVPDGSVDVVFMSNLLEHLPKEQIVATIRECYRMLKPGGSILILQPNIRYTQKDYWMFFDHITPLDDRSLCEVLEVSGFMIKECLPRFLPYTTKSRLPKSFVLVKMYLKIPLLWNLLGGQCFVRAQRA